MKFAKFNLGISEEMAYYGINFGNVQSSAWTDYSPEKVKYRFFGFQLFLNSDRVITER